MAKNAIVHIRCDQELLDSLDALAKLQNRARANLAVTALHEYCLAHDPEYAAKHGGSTQFKNRVDEIREAVSALKDELSQLEEVSEHLTPKEGVHYTKAPTRKSFRKREKKVACS